MLLLVEISSPILKAMSMGEGHLNVYTEEMRYSNSLIELNPLKTYVYSEY